MFNAAPVVLPLTLSLWERGDREAVGEGSDTAEANTRRKKWSVLNKKGRTEYSQNSYSSGFA